MLEQSTHFTFCKLIICIPAHGPSQQLRDALSALWLEIQTVGLQDRAVLLVSNSGVDLSGCIPWKGTHKIIKVPSTYYWGAAVQTLFQVARSQNASHVLLMNHDVILQLGALQELLMVSYSNPQAITSAVSIVMGGDRVESGGYLNQNRTYQKVLYQNEHPDALPTLPYEVDALNGRFVIFPIQAADPYFLMPHMIPHYFADTVLTTHARRSGYRLLVVPKARVLYNTSDKEFKNARQRCDSLKGLYAALFKPYSTRYILGGFFGCLLLADNPVLGLILAIWSTSLRTVKACLEYFGVIPRL
jgi:GT2 family glycosyltransferase